MRAAQILSYGGKEVLKVGETPKPKPGEGEVLVEVYAAATNPFDYKVRQGMYKDWVKLDFPATLGGDVSGVVAETGPGVSSFKVGQEVFGQANAAGGQGSYAEFTPVKTMQLSTKPSNLDFVESASLPLAACSAYQALVDHIKLQKGQKILIHGGGGGIGSLAIQIAKNIGAYVATTTSFKDIDFVKSLGADEVIDYAKQQFNEIITDYDAVFDTVGGDTNMRSYMVLRQHATLVSMVDPENTDQALKHSINYIHQSTQVTQQRLGAIKAMVEAGKIKTKIDKIFSLGLAADAIEYLKTGHPKGKVVIQVK